MLVSILVLMDTLLQQKLGKMLLSYSDEVSILVLMDTLLQLINNKFNNVLEDKGFNPCFNGYTTSTRIFNKILYLSVLQRFFQTLKSHFFA